MAFGINFGKNKQKSKRLTEVDKTETTDQTKSQVTDASKASESATSGATTGSKTGSATTSNVGSSQREDSGSQSNVQRSQLFSDDVLGDVESAVGNVFGDIFSGGRDSLASGVEGLSDFSVNDLVEGGLAQATSRVNSSLDEALGSTFSSIGANAGTNSAAALLANRLETDAASSLAGTRAELTARGEEIDDRI